MKRWIIFVLFSILLSYPAVSAVADSTPDTGKTSMFNYPFLQFPLDSPGGSGAGEKKWDGEVKKAEKKEKETTDKKVDDAIAKAWETK